MQFGLCTRGIVSGLFCLLLAPPSLAQQRHPPVEAYGTLPELSSPALTPDGKHLASVELVQGHPAAVIQTLEPQGVRPVAMPFEQGLIANVRWASNDRLLVTVYSDQHTPGGARMVALRTASIDVSGKNAAVLFTDQNRLLEMNIAGPAILDLNLGQPNQIYASLAEPDDMFSSVRSVFRVDATNGHSERIVRGNLSTRQWFMDGKGNIAGFATVEGRGRTRTRHLFAQAADGNKTELTSEAVKFGDEFEVAGLAEDGKSFVVSKPQGDAQTRSLVARDIASGHETTLYSDPVYDAGVLFDPWSGRVIGAAVTTDQTHDHYFSDDLQAMQSGIDKAFPGKSARAVSWDLARRKVVVKVESAGFPPTYYLLDRSTHAAQYIATTYNGLQDADIGDAKPYTYAARDGLTISAYLTLPPGKQPKNLPTVILPHGGPWVRDEMTFDWIVQFLANRGYAVLQPNFRGSDGYGRKFERAGFGQWGLKMQDDVTDGVNKLIGDGIADPKRICIVGMSYGGYAALAGAAFTPDLYACAASWAGVFDLDLHLAAVEQRSGSWTMQNEEEMVGRRLEDAEKLAATSPIHAVGKIKIPVLLLHGTGDFTVRDDQSETMERALRKAGKKVTLIEIKDQVHQFLSSESRVRWLNELEKFLAENIGK